MRRIIIALFSVSLAFASTLFTKEANAGIISLSVKADVASPYLVLTPPERIVRPRRITMRLERPGVSYVYVVGRPHYHNYRVYRVGDWAPRYTYYRPVRFRGPRVVLRQRSVVRVVTSRPRPPLRIVHREPGVRVRVEAPRPAVRVEVPRPSVRVSVPRPSVRVDVKAHGPKVRIRH